MGWGYVEDIFKVSLLLKLVNMWTRDQAQLEEKISDKFCPLLPQQRFLIDSLQHEPKPYPV